MIRASMCMCAIGALSLLTASASARPGSTGAVIVRTYDTYGVSLGDIETASRTVQALLAAIAIDTRWRNCRIVGRPAQDGADPCGDSVSPNELIVRVVRAVQPFEPGAALGVSFIDPVLRTGTLATIYADRVATLSRTLDVDRGTLLGRTVAHEIGHLLLGSDRHSSNGLMRGLWTRHVLLENRGQDWLFTRQQGLDIQSALSSRMVVAAQTARRERSKAPASP
jgi:hypothetical protein